MLEAFRIANPVAIGHSHALSFSIRRVAVRAIPPDGSFEFVFEGNVGVVAHGAGSAMAVAEVHVSEPGYWMALVSPMTTEAESFGCIDQDVFGSPCLNMDPPWSMAAFTSDAILFPGSLQAGEFHLGSCWIVSRSVTPCTIVGCRLAWIICRPAAGLNVPE